MCGICGFISTRRPDAVEPAVRRMLGTLTRRGPDGEGFAAWPTVGLGHRRLAIIDLSPGGHQPMLLEDESIGLTFNGCIYNFQELRAELEQLGHRFRSQCDTEVLLRGYRQWGIDDLVPRLRGMFAFAIWDNPRQTLYLVRDRLGVKPLVWTTKDGEIAFGSTLAALNAGGFTGSIDPGAVLEFLEFGFVTDAHCIFSGLNKLPPATILEWSGGHVSQRCYWTLPPCDESSRITFNEAVEETERLIVEATRLRLCSDVPLGALLSGGIDSTLVCWALAKLNADVKSFTVGAPADESDESAEAAETARLLGISHQVVDMPAETAGMLDQSTEAFSEPFASQSAQALLKVSKSMRPLVTVVLTGDGADEIFPGYPFLHNIWIAQRTARQIPGWAAPAGRRIAPMIPYGPLRNLVGYATAGLSAYTRPRHLPYLSRNEIRGERLAQTSLALHSLKPSTASARRLLFDVLALHHKLNFTSEFLPKVDGATMYHGLEARSPFLDQKLWEFAASLPPHLHFHGGTPKAILREIVRRHIGANIAKRRKQGFTVPVERWLAERWASELDVLTRTTELERQGWVRPGSLANPVKEARSRGVVPTQLWYLLVLEKWLARGIAK
jgi:asparagine synthase (glutamine-hydrolysing)